MDYQNQKVNLQFHLNLKFHHLYFLYFLQQEQKAMYQNHHPDLQGQYLTGHFYFLELNQNCLKIVNLHQSFQEDLHFHLKENLCCPNYQYLQTLQFQNLCFGNYLPQVLQPDQIHRQLKELQGPYLQLKFLLVLLPQQLLPFLLPVP